MQNIRFLSTASYVPKRIVTNDEIAQEVDTSDEWIREHTGIKARHIAEKTEAASDLGYRAALRAIEKAGIQKEALQMIITATSTPDYLGFPSTACIIQNKLGMKNCFSYDIIAACSGYVFACSSAIDAICSGMADTVLVVGTELFSSIIDWKDRNTCILFGDGAGASILSSKNSGQSRIIARHLTAQPEEYKSLLREGGGTAERAIQLQGATSGYITMNGRLVYQLALKMFVKTIEVLLQKSACKLNDIDYIIPHQANLKMIQNGVKRIGIPMEKVVINIDRYANTSAASIPIALSEVVTQNKIQRGMNILLLGFGAGLTCGGILLEW